MSRIRSHPAAFLIGAVVGLLLLLPLDGNASAPGQSNHRTRQTTPASAAPASSGFVLPVSGPAVVLTPFRPPASRYGVGHRGVDLAATVGGQVRAAGSGTVVFAGQLAGRGVVSIDHPVGLRTTYEPLSALVKAGDRVTAGQVIGVLQAGHPSCAPATCLHWGARLPDSSYLDPMSLLTGLHVRLLPWDG